MIMVVRKQDPRPSGRGRGARRPTASSGASAEGGGGGVGEPCVHRRGKSLAGSHSIWFSMCGHLQEIEPMGHEGCEISYMPSGAQC